MTDFGIPYIDDKNLFAAVQQARRLIVEQSELPSTAIMQAAIRFKVSEVDVGHYTNIGVAWTMVVRSLRRDGRWAEEKPASPPQRRGIDPESIIDMGRGP